MMLTRFSISRLLMISSVACTALALTGIGMAGNPFVSLLFTVLSICLHALSVRYLYFSTATKHYPGQLRLMIAAYVLVLGADLYALGQLLG